MFVNVYIVIEVDYEIVLVLNKVDLLVVEFECVVE